MDKLKTGDEVKHNRLGKGKVVKLIKSSLDKSLTVGYSVKFYGWEENLFWFSQNPRLMFGDEIEKIDKL